MVSLIIVTYSYIVIIPDYFKEFFTQVNQTHTYNTRLASRHSYSLPKVRTNYGKFNNLDILVQLLGTQLMKLQSHYQE